MTITADDIIEELQKLGLDPGRNGDGTPSDAGNGEQDPITEADLLALLTEDHRLSSLQGESAAPIRRGTNTARYGLNDFYHANKIVELHGDDIRYCRGLGGFLVWKDNEWREDTTGDVWRKALHTAWGEYKKADKTFTSLNELSHKKKWALCAARRRNIEDALKQLQAQTEIVATPDMFDRDPWLFNVANGTIDLRTGQLLEHRREDMITKCAPVEFDPACEPPRRWLQFLDEIFDGNSALQDFIRRACGYALTGSVGEQKFFFLHGSGANGKSTFLDALMYVMGDYARRTPANLLFAARHSAHPTALADLKGRRLAVTPEIEFGKSLAEAAVKELTGGDRLTARRGRQDSFEFDPTHKVFVCGNHLPIIRGSGHRIWRRIDLIPFSVTIADERQDKDLPAKLRTEATGILNWLVEGCLEWQKLGLAEPAEVTTATRSYRSDMDILGDFLNDCCVLESGLQATFADLNRAYKEWCNKNAEQAMSTRWLALRLKERGFKKQRTMSVRFWQGLSLKEKGS